MSIILTVDLLLVLDYESNNSLMLHYFYILFAAAVYSARQSNEAEIKRLKASFSYLII